MLLVVAGEWDSGDLNADVKYRQHFHSSLCYNICAAAAFCSAESISISYLDLRKEKLRGKPQVRDWRPYPIR